MSQMDKMGGKHPGSMPVKRVATKGKGSGKSPKYQAPNKQGQSGKRC